MCSESLVGGACNMKKMRNVFLWGSRQHAVSQVHNVSADGGGFSFRRRGETRKHELSSLTTELGSEVPWIAPHSLAASLLDHIHDSCFDGLFAPIQHSRVQVSLFSQGCVISTCGLRPSQVPTPLHSPAHYLHRKALADAVDAVDHVHALVDRDAVWRTCCHAFEQAAATADVEDDGHVGMCLPDVRGGEFRLHDAQRSGERLYLVLPIPARVKQSPERLNDHLQVGRGEGVEVLRHQIACP